MEHMCLLRVLAAWRMHVRLECNLLKYQGKIEAKKQQLVGVQHMFRNFATQLESRLKDDTHTDFKEASIAGRRRLLSKSEGTVSLPNIHAKTGPGTPKPGSGRNRTPGRTSPGHTPVLSPGTQYPDVDSAPPPRAAWAS